MRSVGNGGRANSHESYRASEVTRLAQLHMWKFSSFVLDEDANVIDHCLPVVVAAAAQ